MSATPTTPAGHQPGPARSNEPDQARRTPRWPAWTAPVAFLSALLVAGILSAVVIGVSGGGDGTDPDAISPGALIAPTAIQNLVFLGAAIGFTWMTARPWPQDFGLRATRFWPGLGWAAASVAGFLLATLVLSSSRSRSGAPRALVGAPSTSGPRPACGTGPSTRDPSRSC